MKVDRDTWAVVAAVGALSVAFLHVLVRDAPFWGAWATAWVVLALVEAFAKPKPSGKLGHAVFCTLSLVGLAVAIVGTFVGLLNLDNPARDPDYWTDLAATAACTAWGIGHLFKNGSSRRRKNWPPRPCA